MAINVDVCIIFQRILPHVGASPINLPAATKEFRTAIGKITSQVAATTPPKRTFYAGGARGTVVDAGFSLPFAGKGPLSPLGSSRNFQPDTPSLRVIPPSRGSSHASGVISTDHPTPSPAPSVVVRFEEALSSVSDVSSSAERYQPRHNWLTDNMMNHATAALADRRNADQKAKFWQAQSSNLMNGIINVKSGLERDLKALEPKSHFNPEKKDAIKQLINQIDTDFPLRTARRDPGEPTLKERASALGAKIKAAPTQLKSKAVEYTIGLPIKFAVEKAFRQMNEGLPEGERMNIPRWGGSRETLAASSSAAGQTIPPRTKYQERLSQIRDPKWSEFGKTSRAIKKNNIAVTTEMKNYLDHLLTDYASAKAMPDTVAPPKPEPAIVTTSPVKPAVHVDIPSKSVWSYLSAIDPRSWGSSASLSDWVSPSAWSNWWYGKGTQGA